MNALQLISKLGAAGIKLWLDDEQQLRFKAPKGALTAELKEALIAAKQDVIDILAQSRQSQQDNIPLVDRSQPLPLSFAQQRLWFLDRLDPGNPSFHIVAALKIQGQLDIQILRQCFQTIVARHESLRTTFLYQDNEISQVIREPFDWLLDENYDLSALDEAQQLQRLNEIYKDEALRSFDLTDGTESRYRRICLFRTRLARLSASNDSQGEFVLFITLHHIIADGWSIGILVKEISSLYEAFKQGRSDPLPALEIQYPDFSAWQRDLLASEKIQQQLAYWKKQLTGVSILELPTDKPRPAVMRNQGLSLHFKLPPGSSQALQAFCQRSGKTSFMVLIATFQALLQRYSGQSDICVGTPIANRTHKAIEPLIGCFINTLAIRSQIAEDSNFTQLLEAVNQTSLDAFSHQDVPFEQLVDALEQHRDQSYTPIFQTMFSLENAALDYRLALENLSISRLALISNTSKYDLQLHIVEGEELQGEIEYNTDLFEQSTIERLSQHYGRLLNAVLKNPEQNLASIDLLSTAERQLLIGTDQGAWNDTAHDYQAPTVLHKLFEQQAQKQPEATAVYDAETSLSYRQLDERSNQLAHYLQQQGVGPDVLVGVCMERAVSLSVALLAIHKAGGAYVPFDPSFPSERLAFMVQDTSIPVLLTQQALSQHVPLPDGITEVSVDSDNVSYRQLAVTPPPVEHRPDQLFNVIYTSGSTGKPKGVMVPQAGIINRLLWMQQTYPLNHNDKVLQKTPYSFDVSVWELFWPLITGASLVYAKPEGHKDPAYLRQLIIKQGISTLHFVPSMLGIFLLEQGIEHCESIKRIFCSGEALPLEFEQKALKKLKQIELHNLYGPTEASIDVSSHAAQRKPGYSQVPIGKPIANTQLHVLDQQLQPCPIGVIGELYIGGVQLARGYLNRDDLTQAAFIDNPYAASGHPSPRLYKTGDLARFKACGNIEYIGRIDHQVKVRGFRIELGEIESALVRHTDIKDAAVTTHKQNGNTLLIAYLVPKHAEFILDQADLREFIKIDLPEYMVPNAFICLSELPLSGNGKLNRKALPAPDLSAFQRHDFAAPRSNMETHLAEIWSSILNIEPIGIHDNFFELGGHSLLAAKLVARLRDELSLSVPLRHVFDFPVLQDLAQKLEHSHEKEHNPLPQLTQADRQQALPMSAAQKRLWVIEQFSPGNTAYNMPAALHLKGRLDVSRLEQAFNRLLERHESLRTSFANDNNGEGIQLIHPHTDFKLQIESSPLGGDTANQLQTLLDEEANSAFDLAQSPLMRVRLIKLNVSAECTDKNIDEYALLINQHHIISDGWSVHILQRELVSLYEDPQHHLPAIEFQYADYSCWQKQWLTAEREQHSLNFWLENLAGVPSHLNLPTDRPRPAQQTFNGASYHCNLDIELSNQLNTFSQQQGTTLYTTLLSAYALLLSRYSQETDFCIGTPVAGRQISELEPIIGYFINAVVLRCKLDGNPSIAGLVKRLRDTSLNAFAHQEVPIEKVLEALPLERNLSFPPLAQVGFNFINASMAELPSQLGEMSVDYIESNKVVAKYDFILIVIENSDGLALSSEYNSDLFDADTIAAMMQRFRQVLEFMLADPEVHINSLTLLSSEEQFAATGVNHNDYEKVIPMTAMQRDLYLNAQLHPDTLSNHLAYRCALPKDFSPAVWQQACQWLSDQYEPLRTDIIDSKVLLGDMAYQCIAKPRAIVFEEIDLSTENDAAKLDQAISDVIYRPFDQPAVQLMHYYYLHLPGDKNLGLVVAHHCIADGIAMVIHWRLLAQKIHSLLNSNEAEPPLPPDVFAEYCQQDLNNTDTYLTRLFWQEKLANVEPLHFSLPTDHTPCGRIHQSITLTNKDWLAISDYCRQRKMIPAMLIKMLYGVLIKAYCRPEADFTIAEFVAGRGQTTMMAQGNYFRQLPFVFPQDLLQGSCQITELMEYSNEFYQQSRNHHAISMMAQNQLSAAGGLQFMFNYYPIQPGEVEIEGELYSIQEYPPLVEQSIQFIAKQLSDTIQLDLMYDTADFADLGLLQRLYAMLIQIVQTGAETLRALSLHTANEAQQQLHDWNQTQTPLPDQRSVQQLFEQQVERSPEAVAVKSGNASLRYQALNQQANQLANHLRRLGVGSNTRVGICLPRGLDFPVAVLAVIKAGGAYIPMDISYPQERLHYMLQDADAPIVISQSSMNETLSGYRGKILCIDDGDLKARLAEQADSNPVDYTELNDLLYIIYTSGSTGRPKGAGVQHKGELNLLNWYRREFDLNEHTRCLIISALGFDLTQKNIFGPLISGGCLILPEFSRYDSDAISHLIESERITFINCAPSAFYPIVEDSRDLAPLQSLDTVIMGGEALRVERLQRWFNSADYQASIVNNYGPTECSDIAAFERLQNPAAYINRPVPIGRPNDNVQLYVLNDDLQLLPTGCIGELCIAGEGVGPGYLNHDELNLEKFVANPFGDGQLYRSGDLARYQNDGRLQFVGRKDFQIKINGLRMELGEIEYALREQDTINDALLTVYEQQLVAYITTDETDAFSLESCREQLSQYLPSFMVPTHIVPLKSWPLTPNGKVDRKALPEPGKLLKKREMIAPRTETEEKLAQILCQVLGLPEVSVKDDFFELGGHSLAASRAIVQFRETFAIDIPLNVLFEMTTIEKIAEYIDVSVWANQTPPADSSSDADRDEGFL